MSVVLRHREPLWRRILVAAVVAIALNLLLFGFASTLSRERALPQDLSSPVPVSLITVNPPAMTEEQHRKPPPPPKPKPKPEFEPEFLQPVIGKPEIGGLVVALDPAVFDGGPQANDFVFNAMDLDQPPQLMSKVDPFYPPAARARNLEGVVTVRFLVEASGRVSRASVVDSRPVGIFEDALLEVVPRWRYRPGRIDGKPVSAWLQTTMKFTLEN